MQENLPRKDEPSGALGSIGSLFARGSGVYQALRRRPPFPLKTTLRVHCQQLWWPLSDPAMEEELNERRLYHRFVSLDGAARMAQ